jgi:uncharacterized lipoprotein YddW (UPF0748 family)
MKKVFILTAILTLSLSAMGQDSPELRAFYAPTWNIYTPARCDSVIANALSRNINAVFVEVRARGDAYYYPNRESSTYPNNEPRGELYTISPSDFDPLQYFIDALHSASPVVEVHAWCTTYNSWNRSSPPDSPNHVYNAHHDWITENSSGVTYAYDNDAPLDPGIPEVQEHLFNVFMDIVHNYDVDGIHFDYIRLLSADSGYDPVALAQFSVETGFTYIPTAPGPLSEVYEAWRRDQISQLVQRVHTRTMLEKPWVEVSAFLVNFSDSVEYYGQGYNWWVAHGAIDMLHPGCYSSSVVGSINDWNDYQAKLAQNSNELTRPMTSALGTYLLTSAENVEAVTTLRGEARVPDGFNFFAYDALFQDGNPAQEYANDLFNSGGPMDEWASVPAIPHKPDEETLPPGAPASFSAVLAGGYPRLSFNRPTAAADGDLPVHYRIYRDTDANVDLHYDNMIMEWWDPGSGRISFAFDDTTSIGATYYYAAVAYDDWNNQSVSVTGPLTAPRVVFIIESHDASGALTSSAQGYSQSGSWYGPGSTAKSSAPGLSGSGSEFSTNASLDASYTLTPDIEYAGDYDIYVTTDNERSIDAASSTYSITHPGGPTTGIIALTAANTGDKWTLLASNIYLATGTGNLLTISEGAPQGDRFYSDGVKFILTGASEISKESRPAVSEPASPIVQVIVDSHPQSLDYDDFGGTGDGRWADSNLPGYYNGNARYYSSAHTFPIENYAVWVVDLPQSGKWAIDGWVRHNIRFSEQAQYRFVDSGGVVHDVTTSQRSTFNDTDSGDWLIDVDGVDDANAVSFNAGRVYVILQGNAAGAQALIADALRFRLISAEVQNWRVGSAHWHSRGRPSLQP